MVTPLMSPGRGRLRGYFVEKLYTTTHILKQFKLEWAFLGLNICYFAMTEGKVIGVFFLLQSYCISLLLLKVWSMDQQRQHQYQLGVYQRCGISCSIQTYWIGICI